MIKIYLEAARRAWAMRDSIASDVLYEAAYHKRFCEEEPWIQPNERGARLYAMYEALIVEPLRAVRMERCPHHNMIDESWAGPESGGDGGTCADCGWSFRNVYY